MTLEELNLKIINKLHPERRNIVFEWGNGISEEQASYSYDDDFGVGQITYVPIFNTVDVFYHDFAKTFWGEEEIVEVVSNDQLEISVFTLAWKYHLQRMVLEENPLKYLEKFL